MRGSVSRVLASLAVALTVSCASSPVYWPNSHNTPQVLQRGDVHASALGNTEGFVQAQAAAAITDRIVLTVNTSHGTALRCDECDYQTSRFAELAVGTYRTTDAGRSITWLFGAGGGDTDWLGTRFKSGSTLGYERAEGALRRVFAQVAGVDRSSKRDFAKSLRVSYVWVRDYGLFAKDTAAGSTAYNRQLDRRGRPWSFYLEPSLSMWFRFRYLRVGPQVGASFPMNPWPRFGHRPGSLNLGVQFGAQ